MYSQEEIKEAIKAASDLVIKTDYSINHDLYKEALQELICITLTLVNKQ